MFGSSIDHIRGTFDSEEETRVAEMLIKMRREKYLGGMLPHPKVAGVTGDFLVQLGPQTDDDGQLILLEYDGLGTDRPHGLGDKRQRYRKLSRHGLPARWLTSTSREAIKEVIIDYTPPHFAVRKDVCRECGSVETNLVIADKESAGEIMNTITCTSCELNDDAR